MIVLLYFLPDRPFISRHPGSDRATEQCLWFQTHRHIEGRSIVGRDKQTVDGGFLMQVSAKLGTGVEELITTVIERIPR